MMLHTNIKKLLSQAMCEHPETGRHGWPEEDIPKLFKNLPLGWTIEEFNGKEYAWSPLICYKCGYQEAPVIMGA